MGINQPANPLVLLGGPPGVGKTTVLSRLREAYECLDADDVSPPERAVPREVAIGDVIDAVRSSLCGKKPVVLSWVFATRELYQPFLDQFACCNPIRICLVCAPEVLAKRLSQRGSDEMLEYALGRLELINQGSAHKIDTSSMEVEDVCKSVIEVVQLHHSSRG